MNEVLELTNEEIFEKALEKNVSQTIVEYVEDELETKICKECGDLFDSSNYPYNMEEFEDMSFCTHCGGELEDNCTLDVHDCIICDQSLHEIGEGYVLPNEQKGVCPDCYEHIPNVILTEEEQEEEEQEEKYRKENPLRMIAPSQLAGKTIQRSYHVEWNGALVTHTTDNCICVSYSNYNQFNGVNENGYLKTLEDYYRLC